MERGVVVDVDDEVTVFGRELEVLQRVHLIPFDPADLHGARRVRFADFAEHGGEIQVPVLRRMLGVGFVIGLELQAIGESGEVRRDLPPQGREALAVGGGGVVELVVMVHVERNREAGRQCRADHVVDALHEGWVDGVWRGLGGVRRPPDRDAHGVEARGFDAWEVRIRDFPAPCSLGGAFQRVAHVEPLAELALLGEDIGAAGAADEQGCESEEKEAHRTFGE